jgi:hypothetical protein
VDAARKLDEADAAGIEGVRDVDNERPIPALLNPRWRYRARTRRSTRKAFGATPLMPSRQGRQILDEPCVTQLLPGLDGDVQLSELDVLLKFGNRPWSEEH